MAAATISSTYLGRGVRGSEIAGLEFALRFRVLIDVDEIVPGAEGCTLSGFFSFSFQFFRFFLGGGLRCFLYAAFFLLSDYDDDDDGGRRIGMVWYGFRAWFVEGGARWQIDQSNLGDCVSRYSWWI